MLVAVAAPSTGVTSVGDVAKTRDPEPVSSVTTVLRFALEGVARNVATPAAKPEMPVETGSPVQFVSVPDVGVPRIGVTSVGDVASTTLPVPVVAATVRAVPPALTATIFEPLPESVGRSAKPASIDANSARTVAESACEPVEGEPDAE